MEIKKYGPEDRKYLDPAIDYSETENLKAGAETILALPVESTPELEQYIEAWQELDAAVDESHSRAYVAMTVDTTDQTATDRWEYITQKMMPVWEEIHDRLVSRLLDSPAIDGLDDFWTLYIRRSKAARRVFRKENIPLNQKLATLSTEYSRIAAAWDIDVDGKNLKFVQLTPIFEHPDREKRERVWRDRNERLATDRQRLVDLYMEMVEVRQQMAANAEFADYHDFIWEVKVRDYYSRDDCRQFAETIEKDVVPLAAKIVERRRRTLGLDSIKPWDVSAYDKPPAKPFDSTEQLCGATAEALRGLDSDFGGYFDYMNANSLLDLDTRKGKAPGGYQTAMQVRRLPFIFMNISGALRDWETLLHESGHAVNYWLSREFGPESYRHPPLEFAEVASMSMELIGYYELIKYTDEEQYTRFWRRHLEDIILFLPYMAIVDQFQHGVYARKPADPQDIWDGLARRMQPYFDTEGLESSVGLRWLMQLHIFEIPFYYIEYGIAQLGSLNVWQNSVRDKARAVADYRAALSLGGSVPLPKLYQTAGIPFSFDSANIAPLMEATAKEIGL